MNEPILTRRALCGSLATAAAWAATSSPSFAAGAGVGGGLSPLHKFMKVYASLQPATLWYWYSGIMEMAPQGGAVVPLAGVDTLIRRDVSFNADGNFTVVTTEANYFHGLDDADPLDRIINPVTGRTVAPLHFSEAQRTNIWSQQALAPRKTEMIESAITWREAGPYSWLHRDLHVDTPHPLDMQQWPLEASGARNRTGSFSTHCALTRDISDPALAAAPCSFTYEAIFGWLPWLLMGQRPGQLLWRASGMKLPAIDHIPAPSRARFERLFPAIFTGEAFGPEGVNLWERYRATRKPARP